jgi:hypothetical protein
MDSAVKFIAEANRPRRNLLLFKNRFSLHGEITGCPLLQVMADGMKSEIVLKVSVRIVDRQVNA